MRYAVLGADAGSAHAARLLDLAGATLAGDPRDADAVLDATGRHAGPSVVPVTPAGPLADWAASGAMALTGRADGPPLPAPGAPATAVRGALLAFSALTGAAALPGPGLLGERAAIAGLTRRGPASPGGAFRLLRTGDGRWAGLNLARPSDAELVPALVEQDRIDDGPWPAVTAWAARTGAVDVRERAHLLGIPAAVVPLPGERDEQLIHRHGTVPVPEFTMVPVGARAAVPAADAGRPLVADLSSLWAGPLCAHLLGLAGMRVIKVESTRRPDGARAGEPAFYNLLHAGHEAVAFDLTTRQGVRRLRELLLRADVVIEGSRPRAMAQLGIDPYELVAARPGKTWVAITAYGRTGPWADRPGFGDDVAAAAGLVAWDAAGPVPCGDALADPLTGVHAAVAAAAAVRAGGGVLVDVAMREVALAAAAIRPDGTGVPAGRDAARAPAVAPPRARRPAGRAPGLGADTERIMAELAGGAGESGSRPAHDVRSDDARSDDDRPDDARSDDARSDDDRPDDAPADDPRLGDPRPSDPRPDDARSDGPRKPDSHPRDSHPRDSQPHDPRPRDSQPHDPRPRDPHPRESQPHDPRPRDPRPHDPPETRP